MGRLGLSFTAFWRVLRNPAFAEQVRSLIAGKPLPGPAVADVAPVPTKPVAPVAPPVKAAPKRSEALTLLAVLQREARLVDFLKESIAGYPDDQVGAAVREIHRDAGAALERMFALKAVRTEAEGASVTVPAGYDAGRIKLTGNVTGQPPHTGTLAHAGWEATKVELPEWSGTDASA
ncbi:MAG TPA: DUF2760 domain-containing protein, partial [Humisphaera sp.]